LLMNTSRGMVVNTNALYEGIRSGGVTGACLDVFEAEPVSGMTGDMKAELEHLMHLDNVVVTPHIAGYTFEALHKMSKILLHKVLGLKHG